MLSSFIEKRIWSIIKPSTVNPTTHTAFALGPGAIVGIATAAPAGILLFLVFLYFSRMQEKTKATETSTSTNIEIPHPLSPVVAIKSLVHPGVVQESDWY